MQFIPIKTTVLHPPKQSLYPILDKSLPKLKEGDIVFITSKVLAIHQGRCVPIRKVKSKEVLVRQEADTYLPGHRLTDQCMLLTLKENTLIPNAGIDESRKNGYYILWPINIEQTIKRIWTRLRRVHKVKDIAVVVTDTHSMPLRFGVTGIAIGLYGMSPFYSYKGQHDIFGNPIKTKVNIVDSLAATAVLAMGEGDEQTPVLIARGVPHVTFVSHATYGDLVIPSGKDLFAPLFKGFKKPKRGGI